MNKTNLGFAFNIIALFLFVPGIILPMFSMATNMTAEIGTSALSTNIINKELSLLGTVRELWQDERILVAILIFAFSIAIPVFKTLLLTWGFIKRNTDTERKIVEFVAKIGKWSMADVFVVAVFLAVLSTNHSETASNESFSIIGIQIDFLISSETLSSAGLGFYFFTAYCLTSLLGTQLSQNGLQQVNSTPAA
ncbi:MAG: paraquat-inducible protein A [Gammaproteobacteria bacterium]|nr:paraquat-inducible protein A [Gammaproteobacteria bacterium]